MRGCGSAKKRNLRLVFPLLYQFPKLPTARRYPPTKASFLVNLLNLLVTNLHHAISSCLQCFPKKFATGEGTTEFSFESLTMRAWHGNGCFLLVVKLIAAVKTLALALKAGDVDVLSAIDGDLLLAACHCRIAPVC